MMKKIKITVLLVAFFLIGLSNIQAQYFQPEQEKLQTIKDLSTLDSSISRYFPRWKVCEDNLKVSIYQAFVLSGADKELLDMQDIRILAAPRPIGSNIPFTILLIECGKASMNSVEVERNLGGRLIGFIAGQYPYIQYTKTPGMALRNEYIDNRDYCYETIPADIPVNESQMTAIQGYLEPINVHHAFTVSLFEQSLKIGNTGFWLKATMGNDEIGYPFWSSGEAGITLSRPLYVNENPKYKRMFPYLINAHIGAGYRISSGVGNDSEILGWIKQRKLNSGPYGKLHAGFDISLPQHPFFGLSANAILPFESLKTKSIAESDYTYYSIVNPKTGLPRVTPSIYFPSEVAEFYNTVAPVLTSSGQVAFFYYWMPNMNNPENFFRVDLGICYTEVQEVGAYRIFTNEYKEFTQSFNMSPDLFDGLKMYHPTEFGDWFFFKLQYRNQAAFPFGMSLQYSNQMLLGRVYIPLLGDWLYLDAKYATPLRGVRPYENQSFYVISPLLRITI